MRCWFGLFLWEIFPGDDLKEALPAVFLCPELFQIQGDGLAQMIAQPDGYLEDAAREAAGSCPVSVIHTEEE